MKYQFTSHSLAQPASLVNFAGRLNLVLQLPVTIARMPAELVAEAANLSPELMPLDELALCNWKERRKTMHSVLPPAFPSVRGHFESQNDHV
jgi:hypothetical protein